MTLWVVRHGRTAANASGLLLGRADPPLDEVGRDQAAAVAAVLPAGARVVSSPLARTRQTAAVIAEAGGGPVEIDDRWIELDYGEFDGRPLAQIPSATWAAWRADLAFRPPRGETLAELGARVRAACDDLAGTVATEDVVVVTHVSPVKAAVCWALGVDDAVAWRTFVAPASVTRIAVGDRGPVLAGFNDRSHLGEP